MHRSSGQGDLGQAWLSPRLGRNVRLERISQVFDWGSVDRLVSGVYAARSGRPSWPPLMLVKAHDALRRELYPELRLVSFFQYPSVAALALHIDQSRERNLEQSRERNLVRSGSVSGELAHAAKS